MTNPVPADPARDAAASEPEDMASASPAETAAREGAGGEPDTDAYHAERIVEALLFASPAPMAEAALAARLPAGADLRAALRSLGNVYATRGINLVQVHGHWTLRTAPDLGSVLKLEIEQPRKLSRAAIETLAIIAYHQPVTRAEIEEIRGVVLSKGTLDILFEAGWIRPKGRKPVPGRPIAWATTDGFLSHFGLASATELPGIDDLRAAGLLDRAPVAYGEAAGAAANPTEGESAEPLPLDEDEFLPPDLPDPDHADEAADEPRS